MKKLITLVVIFFSVFNAIKAVHGIDVNQKEADKVASTLSGAKETKDSIRILYDVYALSDRANRKDVGFTILELANRAGEKDVKIDMLNRLASKIDDAEGLNMLLDMSHSLPNDSARRAVELIIAMEDAKYKAAHTRSEDLDDKVREYILIAEGNKADIYDEILDLYRALVYIGATSQGSLYLEYITRMEDLVKRLPPEDFAIRNLYYTTAAIYYTRNRNYEKAIESDKELLKEIDKLQNSHGKYESQYQNFDYSRYISYRRMLANYPGLTKEEVEDFYNKCIELAARNEDVAKEFGKRGLSISYYNMAMHNYKEAIPALQRALSDENLSLFRRRELLINLIEALDSVGDTKGHYEALKQYHDVTLKYRNEHLADAYKELSIRKDVNRMAYEQRIENQKMLDENRRMRRVSLTLVYVLGIALILMCGSYFRLLNKVKALQKTNKGLHTNLEQMFDDGTPRGTHDARIQRGKLKG